MAPPFIRGELPSQRSFVVGLHHQFRITVSSRFKIKFASKV